MQLWLLVRALDEQAWAWRRSPLALVPSSWAVRTPSGGRQAGGRAHSPAAEGTAGEQLRSVPRAPSQAEPVWAVEPAGARVARAGMAVVMAEAAGAVAKVVVIAEAAGAVAKVAAVAKAAGAVAKVAEAAVPCQVDKVARVEAAAAAAAEATFEGRSRCSRCRCCTPNMRLRVRHRRNDHPRCSSTSPCRSARWRSPPSGRGGGCGRAEARTQSGPQSRAEQRVGTRERRR